MAELPQTDNRTEPGQPEPAIVVDVRRQEGPEYPDDHGNSPLLAPQQCASLEKEWQAIQARFVDSPRSSVQEADALVRKAIEALANSFGEMRGSLEQTWERDKEVSTEELRLALQNYRSFFRRLLSI